MSARKSKRKPESVPPTSPPIDVRKILDDFGAGYCMIETAMNSLDCQEIGYPESRVLRIALKMIWPASECLSDHVPHLPDDDEEDES